MKRFLLSLAVVTMALSGCLSDDDADADGSAARARYVVPDVPAVPAADVLTDLEAFCTDMSQRYGNEPDHLAARDYLATSFESFGLDVWRQEFETGLAQENIVGIKWGINRDEWVVVGGHYDMTTTVPALEPTSAGCYDDGSGTMLTVHLAKAFAEITPYYTIAFVGFDGEERGLEGSGAFAQAFVDGTIPDGPRALRGMLNLDMFGLNWPSVDAPIYFDANSATLDAFVQEVAAEIGAPEDAIKYQGINLGRSDYAHFFGLGVPTGFFIADFEEYQLPADVPVTTPPGIPAPVGAYPFWHQLDTWETMGLMAGSEAQLEAGFQTAADLSSNVVHLFSAQPLVDLSDAEVL